MSKKLILGGGAGAFARQKKIKDLWTIITKKIKGINVFKAKPKEAPKTGGWEELDVLGDKSAVDALVAEANAAEKIFKAQKGATTEQAAAVDAKTTLEIANRRLERAKRGESPDPKPSQPRPESKPSKADAEQPRADAEQPKAGAEQPKAGAEPTPAGKPEPAPEPPKAGGKPEKPSKQTAEQKFASQEAADRAKASRDKFRNKMKGSKLWKFIKWGGIGTLGWSVTAEGIKHFEENKDDWNTLKNAAGDYRYIGPAIKVIVDAAPEIAGKGARRWWDSAKELGVSAYEAASASADTVQNAVKAPVKDAETNGGAGGSAETKDGPPPAAKGNGGGAPKVVAAAKKGTKTVALPNTKPATLKRKSEEIPSLVVTDAISPSSANQHAAKKEVKKPPKKKDKTVPWHKGHDPITKYLEGVTGLKRSKATIAKDVAITKELDARDRDNRFARGGSVSSDSYMLRKKPKTTSEVKKGSRQSRSWNY